MQIGEVSSIDLVFLTITTDADVLGGGVSRASRRAGGVGWGLALINGWVEIGRFDISTASELWGGFSGDIATSIALGWREAAEITWALFLIVGYVMA